MAPRVKPLVLEMGARGDGDTGRREQERVPELYKVHAQSSHEKEGT